MGSDTPSASGAELIARERARQVEQEGWSAEHDAEHDGGELAVAASFYLEVVVDGPYGEGQWPGRWPWHPDWWKPSADPIRNLVKAGALIAAEIDRLNAADR